MERRPLAPVVALPVVLEEEAVGLGLMAVEQEHRHRRRGSSDVRTGPLRHRAAAAGSSTSSISSITVLILSHRPVVAYGQA